MHIDARHIDNQSIIEGDICIVGAGAAGISIALEWMNTPYKVILLEGGGFEYDDQVQELYNGKLTGQPYFPMKASRLHYFGGSTGHWGGMCSTFDAIDFEKRDWVHNSGWPITLKDIEPFHARVNPILDLGPNEWDVKYWLKKRPTLKALPLDEKVIWSKMWQYSPPTRFGTKYKDTIVNATNIHLYTYANVVDIVAAENIASIKEVTVKNYTGKEHTVRARYFVMACCSIQNARVLLASNKQAPKGLGNDNDLVGRYFMEHPHVESGELWLPNSDTLDLYRMGKGVTESAELAVAAEKQRELKIMNGTISLTPLEFTKNRISNIKMWSADDPRKSLDSFQKYNSLDKRSFFERHFMPSKLYKAYGLLTRMEQMPNPESRVVLSDEKDALGVPRANLNWERSPIDKSTVTTIIKTFAEEIGRSGVGRVRIPDFMLDKNTQDIPTELVSGGWHQMGTTRMSDDPKTGVVDINCKIHGISNLFVAGASCFTTGGAVNPTYTCVAFSLRLSDHLKVQIKNPPTA
ncbi:MAG: GMC family oxidoreductase [Bacteroidetes bacterium]|nr:GMC family oxidoreductase [Bacteroidota bacterium]